MIIYCLTTITILYYLILWRVTAKKAALKRAAREAFGPVTGIQELSISMESQKDSTPLVPPSSKEEIFGAITNIQELTNQAMSKQNIINSISLESSIETPPFKKDLSTPPATQTMETFQEAQLRHSIFAGSSLAKETISRGKNSDSALIKDTVDAISDKVLEAELDAIVDELDEPNLPLTTTSPTNHTLPMDTLQKSDLVHQLNHLFDKDYQDYV